MARVDPYTVNGNIYGVCYHIGAVLMFYNQGLFDEAGLDWNDIVTWDDFIAMGKEMKERTGAWMTMMDSNLFGFDPLVAQQHSQYIVNNLPNVDTPEAIRALQLMQDMVYVHEMARIMPGYALDSEEHYAAFNNGEGAALWAPAWFLGRFINQMPDLKGQISVGPLPVFQAGNNRSSSAGGTMTAVTNQVAPEKADLALDFVAFAKASYEGALLQWTLLGFDPVRWDVFDDPAMTGPSPAVDYFGVGFAEQFFALLYDIQAETAAIDADQPHQFEIREYLIQYVMPNVLRENNESARVALEAAQARLMAELS
jgi:arabinosaccharide transport system substrate-binding protein